MSLKIVRRDITTLEVDAIVNAANVRLAVGGEENLLRNCYTNSLKLTVEKNLQSIAFPLISSGIYGYPPVDALKTAVAAIEDFLKNNDLKVVFTVMNQKLIDNFLSN